MSSSILFDAPGPKARARQRVLTGLGAILLLVVIYIVISKMSSTGQLEAAKWTPFLEGSAWTSYILPGLWGTVKAASAAVLMAMVFGLAFGLGRLSENRIIRGFCGAVVEFFRSVPVLLMMIFLFFYFAQNNVFSSSMNSFAAVVIALTLYNGSVIAELVRSGVFALPKGQSEAGLSVGLTPFQTLRIVQLPQALTAMLPALISQLVVALKDTALGYQITYPELLIWSKTLGSRYANVVPAYLFAAVMFIIINASLTRFAGWVEQRLKRSKSGVDPSVTATADNILAVEA